MGWRCVVENGWEEWKGVKGLGKEEVGGSVVKGVEELVYVC